MLILNLAAALNTQAESELRGCVKAKYSEVWIMQSYSTIVQK